MKRLIAAFFCFSILGCVNSVPHHNGTLILKPEVSTRTYAVQSTVSPYTKGDIKHLVLKLFTVGVSETDLGISQDVTDLNQNIVFRNLKNATTYRVKAYAYKQPGENPSDLISYSDSRSWTDITLYDDDRPNISPIFVQLADVDFNGKASGSLLIASGSYASSGPENMDILCNTGILIPLYIYPVGGAWDPLIALKNSYPKVPIVAIANPDSSVGTSKNSDYVTGINKLKAAGITVIGYETTTYGAKSSATIKANISNWRSWYGVNGIFLDEMNSSAGKESYYSDLTAYAKQQGCSVVFGNPGTMPSESYVGTVDNLVVYENDQLPDFSTFAAPWMSKYPKYGFSFLAWKIPSLSEQNLSDAVGKVGYVYITDDGLDGNPWDSFAPYLTAIAQKLQAINPL